MKIGQTIPLFGLQCVYHCINKNWIWNYEPTWPEYIATVDIKLESFIFAPNLHYGYVHSAKGILSKLLTLIQAKYSFNL